MSLATRAGAMCAAKPVSRDYCAEHGKNVKPLPSGRVRSSAEIRGDALLNGCCPLCFAGVQAHKPNRSWICPLDRRTLRVMSAEFAEQVANRDETAPASTPSGGTDD